MLYLFSLIVEGIHERLTLLFLVREVSTTFEGRENIKAVSQEESHKIEFCFLISHIIYHLFIYLVLSYMIFYDAIYE